MLCTDSCSLYHEGLVQPQTIRPCLSSPISAYMDSFNDPKRVLVDLDHYVSCQVSQQSDRLNAFLGILHAYQSAQVCHVWRMPVSIANECSDVDQGFARSLYWWPEQAEEVCRHEHFPSWSWLTANEWPIPFTAVANASTQPPVTMQVSQILPTSHDERTISLCDHVTLMIMGADPSLVSPIISITG